MNLWTAEACGRAEKHQSGAVVRKDPGLRPGEPSGA